MLVHPDVLFTAALAEHRHSVETRMNEPRRETQAANRLPAGGARNRRRRLRIAHS